MTFDIYGAIYSGDASYTYGNGPLRQYEVFGACRNSECGRSVTFLIEQGRTNEAKSLFDPRQRLKTDGNLNEYAEIVELVTLATFATTCSPDHVPPKIADIFAEGSKCFAIGCWNAAGSMFRLCLDLVSKDMLPDPADHAVTQPTANQRKWLGNRLDWLFEQNKLPVALKGFTTNIQRDGNDAAHDGTLTEPDAHDLLEFSLKVLERVYTEPEEIRLAEARRKARRAQTP